MYSQSVEVYAHWSGLVDAELVGVLGSDVLRGKEAFRFSYARQWLQSDYVWQIDPELLLYQGEQFSRDNPAQNFRGFLDSCPDRWGRLLMDRREAYLARTQGRRPAKLSELDYLLGVHDSYRQGALRFKHAQGLSFLDDNAQYAAPPMSSIRELEYAANRIEERGAEDDPQYVKWLSLLMAPGSSLGGARPKASVVDASGALWIAKFPSKYDGDQDVAAWEYLVYRLALNAGLDISESKIQRFQNANHTFMTKRFDREGSTRIHFASAMTQLGFYDGWDGASYLDIAQFITENGANAKADLAQLWRRIVFNIAVSNTDDHLRNHGFLLTHSGWRLSPAYDLNPNEKGTHLQLNIDEHNNTLDFDIALSVYAYFQLTYAQANDILVEVKGAVAQWRALAIDVGISKQEIERMQFAFHL